jgi:transcriptional regulator with XRE-family HTH domain
VFDLGRSLRAAREARGLELAGVEELTKIRARYLLALEEERFEDVPLGYQRSFLRSYAEFLGLDPRHYLDEYASRFPAEELQLVDLPVRRRRLPFAGALVAVAVVAIVVAMVAAAHFGHRSEPVLPAQPPPPRAPHRTLPPIVVQPPKRATKPKPRPHRARVVIRAVGGDCWLSVRAGSPTGAVLYERTLVPGQELVTAGRPLLWVRLGAPRNVELTVNGHRVGGLDGSAPLNLLVGPGGARPTVPGYVPARA